MNVNLRVTHNCNNFAWNISEPNLNQQTDE